MSQLNVVDILDQYEKMLKTSDKDLKCDIGVVFRELYNKFHGNTSSNARFNDKDREEANLQYRIIEKRYNVVESC